jgi:hypothetical protein
VGLGCSRPKSSEGTNQRRGERGGGARAGRGKPVGVLSWAGVAGVGLPPVSRSSGEVRPMSGGAPAREGGMGKSGRTSRSKATRLEPRFGRRRSRKWGLMVRSSGGANGGVVVVLGHV